MKKIDKLINIIDSEIKLKSEEVFSFLNSEETRSYLINYYNYFNEVQLNEFKEFINQTLERNLLSSSLKADILDLCVTINYFDDAVYDLVKTLLLEKNNYLLKLSALDYLNSFYYSIICEDYFFLNEHVNKFTRNPVVKFQTDINLMLLDYNHYSKLVCTLLQREELPSYYYYRMANCLSLKQFSQMEIKDFLIQTVNKKLESKQIEDILRILK